jgi:alkanesulfonate monooxygenase SsuD/methylene tetrahydromethanopterin reductase-like flavin-dependent oxidoreductase (luciferase family)
MHFGIYAPNFGEFADPRVLADLARAADAAGWEGFFIWDHMLWHWPDHQPMADPAVALAAMAAATERIRLGALVTPIARRRPWKLAREAVTLDHLSGGRLVQGVGIGGDWFGDYSGFGEPPDDRTHAEMLDEGLTILDGLWRGAPFSYAGRHYQIKDVTFLPPPVQQPRIPIWVAGNWPNKAPFRRAARWDGVFPLARDGELTPADFRDLLAYMAPYRTSGAPFDVVYRGNTAGVSAAADRAIIAPYAEAGVTWWLESCPPEAGSLAAARTRIAHGPPRL